MPADPRDNPPSDTALRDLRRLLLRWYRAGHRAMPWRARPGELPEPYHVLVSEAMLQQTQVATVVGYFKRFIEAFPTLAALAAGEEQQVLKLWQGLGYYQRARRLHAAARAVVERFGGRLPATLEELRTLPGVGPYTAGAIASIAFHQPAGILDGNVARVLARVFALEEPVDSKAGKAGLWLLAARAAELRGRARGDNPGDFNQSLMELGATVCLPRSPTCPACPLASSCQALARGWVDRLPRSLPRKRPLAVTHRVLAVAREGAGGVEYLFEQRGEGRLWAAMWQFPTREDQGDADAGRGSDTADSASDPEWEAGEIDGWRAWCRERFGLEVSMVRKLGAFQHATTHRRIRFVVSFAWCGAGRLIRKGTGVWRRLDRLEDLPLPNPQRRAVAMVTSDRDREGAGTDHHTARTSRVSARAQ